jgi:hypothetical protein
MKYSQIISAASAIVSNLAANPPQKFSGLVASINRELDLLGVAFEGRRYVCAAIAQEARSRALGVAPPASKVLRKVAAYAYDAHDEWAAAGFFLCGSARRATQEELDMRRMRENMIADYVEGAIQVVGAMRDVVSVSVNVAPAIVNAQVIVPAEAVKRRVDAKAATLEAPTKPDDAPAASTASPLPASTPATA